MLAAKSATTTIPIVMATCLPTPWVQVVCQSGTAGRQCHRELEFIARAKYAKGWRYLRTRFPACPSWISAPAPAYAETSN